MPKKKDVKRDRYGLIIKSWPEEENAWLTLYMIRNGDSLLKAMNAFDNRKFKNVEEIHYDNVSNYGEILLNSCYDQNKLKEDILACYKIRPA